MPFFFTTLPEKKFSFVLLVMQGEREEAAIGGRASNFKFMHLLIVVEGDRQMMLVDS